MAQQTISKQTVGLVLSPNKFGLPPGALFQAENCTPYRPNTISKRRGLSRYGTQLAADASAITVFDDTLVLLQGTTLSYDGDGSGTWADMSGTYSPPDASTKMPFLESNLNLYLGTSLGVYVLDTLGNTPKRAGTPYGLDVQLALTHTGGGWMDAVQVAYRITFVREDDNDNVKEGTPSPRTVVTNPEYEDKAWTRASDTISVTHTGHGHTTGDVMHVDTSSDATTIPEGDYTITVDNADEFHFTGVATGDVSGTISYHEDENVTLTTSLPDDVEAGDLLKIYRTVMSADDTTSPGDECFLVYTHTITSGDVTNGYVTFSDTYSEDYLDTPLYTNSSVDGLGQAKDRPPFAKYMATFAGHTFYAGCRREHQLELQLTTVTGLVDGTSSLTFTDGTTTEEYVFAAAESIGDKEFQRHTSGTSAANIRDTMQSFCKIVNRASALLYALYVSGEDDAPGKVVVKRRDLVDTAFSVIANNSTTGGKLTPTVPTSGTTLASEADDRENVLWRSRAQEPEAVPTTNTHKVGRANRAILGIVSTRDALLVFTEGGTHILSGESDGAAGSTFALDELDPTLRLLAPGSLRALEGAAYGWTDQGAVRVTPAGAGIVSENLSVEFRKVSGWTDFSTITDAVAWDTERLYIVWVQKSSADSRARQAYVYNYILGQWSTWSRDVGCGVVNPSDQRLYLCTNNGDKYVLQMRDVSNGNGDEYQDEALATTISAVGTTTYRGSTVATVTITGWTETNHIPSEGWRLVQGSDAASVRSVAVNGAGSYILTMSDATVFSAGAATLYAGYLMRVQWADEEAGNAGVLKQFTFGTCFLEQDGGTHTLGFKGDTQSDFEDTDAFLVTRTRGWGISPWGGSTEWGTSAPGSIRPLRTLVPRGHQICRTMSVRFQNRYARDQVDVLQLNLDVRTISNATERR